MASRRRTAEDKNTKLLREIASIPCNKQCFDCLQRGPTYINVTIGSFVCTTCSGLLRGLTPPHRVKSISMTTFTPDEIENLKNKGNEYCRYVWLGTYDFNANSIENEVSDDQRKRDFMVQKYEKKRWYVDPDIAVSKMQNDHLQKQKISQSQNSIPKSYTHNSDTQPLSTLLGTNAPSLVVHNYQRTETWPHPVSSASAPAISTKTMAQNKSSRSIDLLSELGSDNLATSTTAQATSTGNENFANFANFETAFSSEKQENQQQKSQPTNHQRKTYTPPAGWTSFDDDLDPLSSPAISSFQTLNLGNTPLSHICSSTAMPRPLSLPTFAPTNPFKLPLSGNASTPSQWPSFSAATVTAPGTNLPMSASLDAYPTHSKPVHQDLTVNTLSPPPVSSASAFTPKTTTAQANADRYAALADLDSFFHQPSSTKAPSWTVETTTSSSCFDIPVTSSDKSNIFTSAPSNPFTSTEIWNQPQVTKSQSAFKSANPFQSINEGGLVYAQPPASQVYAPFPIPMVGNSPSDDSIRNQFNANFANFAPQAVTSPTNGYSGTQLIMQNGGFASPTTGPTWGMTSNMSGSMWSSSQLGSSGLFAADTKPTDPAQHSDWVQNPVNPFMVQSNNLGYQTTPRNNPSNPFL